MAKSGNAPGFWHCRQCQTPNPSAVYLTACIGCGAPRASAVQPKEKEPKTKAARPASAPARARRPEPENRGAALAAASWGFAGLILFVLTLSRWWGDLWWPGTFLLYMPRLPWLIPVVVLALWNLRVRLWSLWGVHAAIGLLILGPLMAFHLPWARLLGGDVQGQPRLRILTLNRNEGQFDADRLVKLLEDEQIDLICFQEGRGDEEEAGRSKLDEYLSQGWHWDQHGFLVSRLPIVDQGSRLDPPFPEYGFWGVRLVWIDLKMEGGEVIRLAGVHMPTMASGFRWLFQGDFAKMSRFQDWRRQQVSEILKHVVGDCPWPILLAGDFNAPPESPLMDPLRRVFRFGHEEAGLGYGYTRPTAFPWIQIDQILASSEWTFTRCWVGPDVGSDHLPLIAEVALNSELVPRLSPEKPVDDEPVTPLISSSSALSLLREVQTVVAPTVVARSRPSR